MKGDKKPLSAQQCWMAMLSAPTCSGVSYITTGSAMFYPARAKIEFCLRLKFLQWGRAWEQPPQPPLPHWDLSTLNLPAEIRRYLVPEGAWPFRFPVKGSKSDHWGFQTRQQIFSDPSRCAAVAWHHSMHISWLGMLSTQVKAL